MHEVSIEPASKRSDAKHPPVRILLACMPKSGSTFLNNVVGGLPGFSSVRLVPSFGRREQELDEFRLQNAGRGDYIAQAHVRHSFWTAKMCRNYGLRPVVLVRSLLDVVVSLRDHIRRESAIWPILYAEASHAELDDTALENMIARLAVPWYLNFYMGWRAAPGVHMVSYEELKSEPERVVRDILEFSGAMMDERAIAKAVAQAQGESASRFNVGVSGRGSALKPETIRSILDLFDFYPEAAGDPYVRGVRAQGLAALEGRAPPPFPRISPGPAGLAPARTRADEVVVRRPKAAALARLSASARRYGWQAGLIALALAYWILPNDLIPDNQRFGLVDDVAVLIGLSYAAGRIHKRTPKFAELSVRWRRVAHRWRASAG